MTLRTLHRSLGLAAAIFWLVQAATGVAIAFRVEIDNLGLPGTYAPADPAALAHRIAAVEQAGGDVGSLWVANYDATRFDLYYAAKDGEARLMRMDGQGRPLRDAASQQLFADGAVFRTLTKVHASLMAGTTGQVILGVSAVLLLTNIAAGLKLAWPMRGRWRQALAPKAGPNARARVHAWHRAAGLWSGFPLLVVVFMGLLLVAKAPLEDIFEVKRTPPLLVGPTSNAPGDLGAIVAAALAKAPGATLTAVLLPTDSNPWVVVRLRAPGEGGKIYGMTTIFADPRDGRIAQVLLASEAGPARAAIDALHPLHSGQAGGIAGRMLVAACGVVLAVLCVLGLVLAWVRRKRRA